VIGALVIFSAGVLMVLQLTMSLSRQMDFAATTSEIVVRAQEQMDSVTALPFDSLTLGASSTSLSLRGIGYTQTLTVSSVTNLLFQIDVSLAPTVAGQGPTYAVMSYAAAEW
jgi:hypothetical protein